MQRAQRGSSAADTSESPAPPPPVIASRLSVLIFFIMLPRASGRDMCPSPSAARFSLISGLVTEWVTGWEEHSGRCFDRLPLCFVHVVDNGRITLILSKCRCFLCRTLKRDPENPSFKGRPPPLLLLSGNTQTEPLSKCFLLCALCPGLDR